MHTQLQNTLSSLHENLSLLENCVISSLDTRRRNRVANYVIAHNHDSDEDVDRPHRFSQRNTNNYVNTFMAVGGTRVENSRALLFAVRSVYFSLCDVDDEWLNKVGRMIYRNVNNIDLIELSILVSRFNRLSVPIKRQIISAIVNIQRGNVAAYA